MKLLIVVIGLTLAGLAIAKAPKNIKCSGDGDDRKCALTKGNPPKGWTCSGGGLLGGATKYCVEGLPKGLAVNNMGKVIQTGFGKAPEGWECANGGLLGLGERLCTKAEADDDSAESKKEKRSSSEEEEVPAAYFQSSEEFY